MDAIKYDRQFTIRQHDILDLCGRLNFHAIAHLLEESGYNDPDGTIQKLRTLSQLIRLYAKLTKTPANEISHSFEEELTLDK